MFCPQYRRYRGNTTEIVPITAVTEVKVRTRSPFYCGNPAVTAVGNTMQVSNSDQSMVDKSL